ncbi:MAG: HAMP domain-containing histidine kinase [Candidatus Marithrix sp.]|nr:HAMP domain-containing histidine kinase [Candidatus Marithrix sp.]
MCIIPRHGYLFFIFIFILLIFFGFASWLIASQQRNLLLENERQRDDLELKLISDFISDSFIKNDYGTVHKFLLDWAKKREHVISFTATTKNGFKFVQYSNDNGSTDTHFIRLRVSFGQNNYIDFEMIDDNASMEKVVKELTLKLLVVFLIIIVLLGFILWIALTKIALIPLEKEISKRTKDLQNEIMERKKIEQGLIKLNQEKNEFLGIVAHDLKNPLSVVKGYSEEIKEYCHEMSQEEIIELSSFIKKAAAKMFTLITNLLDVNQIESGKLKLDLADVDIFPIIKNIAQDYAKIAKEKDINLYFKHEGSNFHTYVDTNTVIQILDNIISNAIKYSPLGKNIYVNLIANTNDIRCEIKDEGQGLSKEDQKKLFGKFSRLSSKPTDGEHSTGLGLFIVKKLIEAIDAEVWCESELNQGATFIVKFRLSYDY